MRRDYNMDKKKCTKCEDWKLLQCFSKDKRQKYGVRPECKVCEYLTAGRSLKTMKNRIKNDKNYKNMEITITKKDLEKIPAICFFCNIDIKEKQNIHRLNNKKGYMKGNITKAHQSCHLSYHNKFFKRNKLGQYSGKEGY